MEMVRSACDPRWRDVAGALSAGEGNAKVSGLERRTDTTSAIVANSLLMHAFNREDSYCTAAHPGLVVVPTALALQRSDDAAQLLKAVAVGYAIAGSLTDGLMPRASEAGWRVAALTAPVTAASVAAVLLDLDDDYAVSALRISAACMGGDLRTLAGDDWRVQPGLFAVAGVYAARAAVGGGVRGAAGALESIAAKVLGEPWNPADHDPTPAIMRVTFKRHAAPMFAQAIIEALEGAGEIDEPCIRSSCTWRRSRRDTHQTAPGASSGWRASPTSSAPPSRSFPQIGEYLPRPSSCVRLRSSVPSRPAWSCTWRKDGCCSFKATATRAAGRASTSPRGADPGRGRSARPSSTRSTRRPRRRRPPCSCWMRGKRPSSPWLVDGTTDVS